MTEVNLFIDSFSIGLEELSRREGGDDLLVLKMITDAGRFSAFEVTNNTASAVTRLLAGPFVKVDPASRYPWTNVALAEEGRCALAKAGYSTPKEVPNA